MSFQQIIDQPRVVDALRRAIERKRVAHAYLFFGPDGVGKRAAALAFAKALQCERGGPDPCDVCTSCSKVNRLIHPDVQVLLPSPKDTSPEDIAERLQLLAGNPYATVDYVRRPFLSDPSKESNKQALYRIEEFQEDMRRQMGFKPLEGRYKIAIITDADLLRNETANAFLKLLEEPPPQTVFVLTTSRPERLLPTILSRCQRLRFDLLSTDAIAQALHEREGIEPTQAAVLARMADGSYARALDLAGNEDLLAGRQLVLDYLRAAYANNVDKLADLADQMAGMGRERLKGTFSLMLRWIRDLLLYRTMGADAPLVNVDQQDVIERFCKNIPGVDIEAMILLVEQAMELVERNVHQGLIVTTLAQRLHQTMRGTPVSRLYIPLVEANGLHP